MTLRVSRRRLLQGTCGLVALAPPSPMARDASDSEILGVREFGAIGDGIADDTKAFVALHAYMRLQQDRFPNRRFGVDLPPGHYRYRWNRWTWGIRRITVRGYGAEIQCISDSEFDLDKYALVTNRDFFETAKEWEAPGKSQRSGYPIITARPGDRSISLKMAANAGCRIGDHVLILSYDQQFYGYPPNCRYFDFARVTGIEAGHIRLDRPLRNLHCDDYPGSGDAIPRGPAQLLAIDQPDVPLAWEQRFYGLKTLANPNRQGMGQHLAAMGVLDFVAEDCTFVSFIASCGDRFTLARTIIEDVEPDKLVNEIGFFDCRLGTVTEATGVNRAHFRKCEFLEPVQQEARRVSYDACTFRGGLGPGLYRNGIHLRGFAPTRSLSIRDCTFLGRGERTARAIAENPVVGVRIGAPVRLRDGDGLLEMPFTDEAIRRFVKTLEPRGLVLVDRGGAGEPACDGRYGLVRAVTADRDTLRLALTFSAPVAEGDWLWVPRVSRIVARGNAFHRIDPSPPWAPSLSWNEVVEADGAYRWTLTSDGPADIVGIVSAVPIQIAIEVTRPYRGSEPEAFLRLFAVYPEYGSIDLVINCRSAGRRVVNASASSGDRPDDELRLLPANRFVWSLKLQFAPGARRDQSPLPGSPEEQAHCHITLLTRRVLPAQPDFSELSSL
jgi:hypothetical protein